MVLFVTSAVPVSSQKSRTKRAITELGTLLRDWRDMRGKNQIDLSLDTGVSQRYISFIESGRSVPSRQTLMDIAEALDIPLRDRNTLLRPGGLVRMTIGGHAGTDYRATL